jgi:hypothetical protein
MTPFSERLPLCPLCNEPVELENSITDEAGKAVHEDCYLQALKAAPAPNAPKKIART